MIEDLYVNERPVRKTDTPWLSPGARKVQQEALARADHTLSAGLRNLVTGFLVTDSNNAFSPCTLYCALAFLSELCAGNSKKEILHVLHCSDRDIAQKNETLIDCVTSDSELAECSVSTSIWLNDDVTVYRDALLSLCRTYQAEAYRGRMGTEETDSAIRNWLNSKTGNMLSDHMSDTVTRPATQLQLLSASYFRAQWESVFLPMDTKPNHFHAGPGRNVLCEFMNCREDALCVCGHQFTAVSKELWLGHRIWFIKPNNGVSLSALSSNEAVIKLLIAPEKMAPTTYDVSMSIPKFDIFSEPDIRGALRSMGIRSVFRDAFSEISPLFIDSRLYLSDIDSAVRVAVTEDGIEAASCVLLAAAAGMPNRVKRLEFKLDRPFLFSISKEDKIPLYVGAVIDPSIRNA